MTHLIRNKVAASSTGNHGVDIHHMIINVSEGVVANNSLLARYTLGSFNETLAAPCNLEIVTEFCFNTIRQCNSHCHDSALLLEVYQFHARKVLLELVIQ